jgi:hypothetical protein
MNAQRPPTSVTQPPRLPLFASQFTSSMKAMGIRLVFGLYHIHNLVTAGTNNLTLRFRSTYRETLCCACGRVCNRPWHWLDLEARAEEIATGVRL